MCEQAILAIHAMRGPHYCIGHVIRGSRSGVRDPGFAIRGSRSRGCKFCNFLRKPVVVIALWVSPAIYCPKTGARSQDTQIAISR